MQRKSIRYLLYLSLFLILAASIFIIKTAKINVDYGAATNTNGTTLSPFGNILSAYLYYVGIKADPQILTSFKTSLQFMADPELKHFYTHLDWKLPKKKIAYATAPESTWHQLNNDGKPKANYMQFWQTMRPLIRNIYAQNFPGPQLTTPVVHFRCSDTPFSKHNQYHLTKASSVKWMAKQIKDRGYDQVIMLSCNSHKSLDQNSCQKYAAFYTKVFNSEGISVQTQCNTIMQDFAMMVHSPLLVTLNASSFSFMAGIAKDQNNYISCNMGREYDGRYYLQKDVDWIVDYEEPLLHAEVKDYNVADDVIARLRDI